MAPVTKSIHRTLPPDSSRLSNQSTFLNCPFPYEYYLPEYTSISSLVSYHRITPSKSKNDAIFVSSQPSSSPILSSTISGFRSFITVVNTQILPYQIFLCTKALIVSFWRKRTNMKKSLKE